MPLIRKIIVAACLLNFLWAPIFSFAAEPVNLAITKKELKQYHDSGKYINDIKAVDDEAFRYLQKRLLHADFNGKKPAIVLDIDETALSNYQNMVKLDFGSTLKEIIAYQDKGIDPAIQPTLALYQYARSHHVAVFFITGRFEYERKSTEKNLQNAGYHHWDRLIMRKGQYNHVPAAVYKTAFRKQLTENGYDILANIGDQYSDLNGGYADKTFKLSNPYYFIP